jgi:hypothetical protein
MYRRVRPLLFADQHELRHDGRGLHILSAQRLLLRVGRVGHVPGERKRMLTALALCALSAVPHVAVVASSNRPGAEAYSARALKMVEQALLAREGISLVSLTGGQSCEGRAPCLGQLARSQASDTVVVGVDVTKIQKSLAIHADAVNASGDVLATLDLALPIDGWLRGLAGPLETFTDVLAKQLMPARMSEPEAHAPPESPLSEPAPPAAAPGRMPVAVPVGATVGGLALLGTSIAFALSSQSLVARYNAALETSSDGAHGTSLSLLDVQKLQAGANTRATVALALGVAAGALVLAAVLLFLQLR